MSDFIHPRAIDILIYNNSELLATHPATNAFVHRIETWKNVFRTLAENKEVQLQLVVAIVREFTYDDVKFLCWDAHSHRWDEWTFMDSMRFIWLALQSGFGQLRRQELSLQEVNGGTNHHGLAHYATYDLEDGDMVVEESVIAAVAPDPVISPPCDIDVDLEFDFLFSDDDTLFDDSL